MDVLIRSISLLTREWKFVLLSGDGAAVGVVMSVSSLYSSHPNGFEFLFVNHPSVVELHTRNWGHVNYFNGKFARYVAYAG